MHQEPKEPTWGEPPIDDVVARLLAERYGLRPAESFIVDVDLKRRSISLSLNAQRSRYSFSVRYLRGAGDRDPWALMLDALDALYGMFVEQDRAYRLLPTGNDVEWGGAFFHVEIVHDRPDLAKLADQLLRAEKKVTPPRS